MRNATIREDLLHVHVQDAALLVGHRRLMTEAANVRMADIYELDQRLDGHFRYLLTCRDPAVNVAAMVFDETPELGEAAVLASLSMQRKDDTFADKIFEAMEDPNETIFAVAFALQYCDKDARRHFLTRWLQAKDARLVCIALEVAIQQRLTLGDNVTALIADERPSVRARAVQYVSVMGLTGYSAAAKEALKDADAEVAFAAAVAACRFRLSGASEALLGMVSPDRPAAQNRQAVEVGFLQLEEDPAQAHARALIGEPQTRRWGILALGVIGAVRTISFLIDEMGRPETARIAGWSFMMITGANIAEDDLEMDEFPDDPENPIVDDCAHESFLEAALPWPDTARVEDWVATNGADLADSHPLLFGLPHWSHQDMDTPDLEFQGRYRALAQLMSVQQPDNRLPQWRNRVLLRDQKLMRDWKM